MESTGASLHIRVACKSDRAFILGLVPRFVAFELPPWRDADESADGIRRDLVSHLDDRPDTSHLFVAETAANELAGFLHIQRTIDFFTGAANCHLSDLAVAPGMDGHGIGARLLEFSEEFARGLGCRFITLGVFPGNARARALYERHGYGVELLRMTKSLD
jgi:ribosomal protein S18 acetylase RimI-like enzyme